MQKYKEKEKEALLRTTEQCLCHFGLLSANECRAKGGAPRKYVTELVEEIEDLLRDYSEKLRKAIYSKKDKVYYNYKELEKLEDKLWFALQQALNDYIDKSLRYGIEEVSSDLGIEIKFSQIDKDIIANLEEQSIILSQSIAAKISGNVKQTILEAQRLGHNLEQTIQKLQSISTLTHYEAERIARTELAKAANMARLEGYKGRVEKVEWVLGPAYNGECVCGDYAGVHGIEEAQSLPMPAHPNCDCYWAPVVETDEEPK